jgi:small conductance mechanosensitive channel
METKKTMKKMVNQTKGKKTVMVIKCSIFRIILFNVMAVLVVLGYAGSVLAEKSIGDDIEKASVKDLAPEVAGEQASRLLASINDVIKQGKGYETDMQGASEEDRLVLTMQMHHLREKVMGDIYQLSEVLLEMEKKGSYPELRQEVVTIYDRVTPSLWYHIDGLEKQIDASRARRTKAKTEERFTIENTVDQLTRQLNTFYELSLAHIQEMEKIGMDTRDAKETFARLMSQRADKLSGRIELAVTRVALLEKELKEVPGDADVTSKLNSARSNLALNTDSLEIILNLMEAMDLDTETLRTQLVTLTRDISSGFSDAGVAMTLLKRWLKGLTNWFSENGSGYIAKLFIALCILAVFRVVTRVLRAALEKALDASRVNLSELARRMLISWTSKLVMLFGIMLALSQLGISLGPLLAGLGVAGFIVGFALQDTLGNFAAGVMILMYRPYDVGDLIDVGGVFGTVHKMNLVSTTLLTLDNQVYVVPNSKIWGDVIKNVTAQKTRRIDMVFGISYSDDIPKAETILMDILESHQKVLETPEPEVHLHTLGESSVDFVVRPWVNVDDYWDVYWGVTRDVKLRFDKEGVSIPFPQRDVHVYHEGEISPATV